MTRAQTLMLTGLTACVLIGVAGWIFIGDSENSTSTESRTPVELRKLTPLSQFAALIRNGKSPQSLMDLMDKHADLTTAQDESGNTVLHLLGKRGYDYHMLNEAVKRGADIEAKNTAGETALHLAAQRNRLISIAALLKLGAIIDVRDKNRMTPLMKAADWNYPRALTTLIKEGKPNLNAQDSKGRTALHIVAAKNREGCVQILCEAGADRSIKDQEGQIPEKVAQAAGHKKIATLLMK